MTLRSSSGFHMPRLLAFENGGAGTGSLSTNGLVLDSTNLSSGGTLAPVSQAASLASAAGTGFTVTIGTPVGSGSGLASANAATLALAASDPALGKLQNGLAEIYQESQVHIASLSGAARTEALDTFHSVNGAAEISGGMIAIDAVATNGDGAALLVQLEALGLQSGASYGAMAGGYLPLDALDSLAHASLLAFARPVYAVTESAGAGSVISQDVQAMHADAVQTSDHLTGAGITIGILSDSFNTSSSTDKYANDVASGDLPAGINIIEDHAGGTDEGRAMAQLAYDIAPGAKFDFYTADTSEADFANGIIKLSQLGANIIVDDIRYFDEPMFQDGIIAQAEEAAYSNGAMIFSSAGNYADRAYESAFRDSGQTYTYNGVTYALHDFDPGAGISTAQSVTQSGTVNYVLQWDQPFFSLGGAGATSDLAMFFFVGSTLIAVADSTHPGGDPVEIGGIQGSGTLTVEIGVVQGTPLPNEIKYAMIGGSSTVNNFATSSATLWGHANAADVVAVGAADWYNTPAYGQTPPLGEYFTSKGGQEILFDDSGNRLATPEAREGVAFTAADGGNTTFFSSDVAGDADSFPNFYGTSAAAPNAAAIAALLMQADPHATRDQILAAMKASAIDISNLATGVNNHTLGISTGAGTDAWTGTGLIQADVALSNLLSTVVTNVPALTGLSGTATHAVEQGSAVTLLASAPTITDSASTTLASATVQITGGTFSTNESSSADDLLSVPASALAGTNISASYDAASETLTLSGTDTIAHYEAVLAAVQYVSSGDNPTNDGENPSRIVTWTVNDGLTTPTPGQQNSGTTNIAIDAVDDAPVNVIGGTRSVTEDTPVAVTGLSISDVDALSTASFTTTLTVLHGTLVVDPVFQPYLETMTITGSGSGTVQLAGTKFDINYLFSEGALSYHPDANYNGADTLHIVTSDGGATGSGGPLTDTDDMAISIAAVNDTPVASVPGAQYGTENTSLVFSSANGNAVAVSDVDANGGTETVTLSVAHGTLTLSTENALTVTGDGTGSVQLTGTIADIDTALNGLAYRGVLNYSGSDTLNVNVNDNGHSGGGGALSDQEAVAITLAPSGFTIADPTHTSPSGTPGNDLFWFVPGGTYNVNGLAGSDLFYFGGGGMTNADAVDGGTGADQIALQGDYWTTPLTLGAGVVNIESLYLMPGNDTRGGDNAGNHYSYDIVTVDANVAAGQQLTVDGSQLRSGEDFTFDGSAETNGFFYLYAGAGVDTLTAGHGNDVFLFNAGTLGPSDHVDGGPGNDQLALRGDYDIVFGDQMTSIESLYLVSAHDRRLAGGGTDFTYNLTMNDANVAAGQQMTVDGSALHVAETLTFDASAETNGSYRVFGGAGNDGIIGSHGNDILVGEGGADSLTGGAGNDTFLYRNVSDSTPTSHDTITDFTSGDIIDLSSIDANTTVSGNQAFTFIGSNAFGHHAGELQAINTSGDSWTISADVNGDGVADFQIVVNVADHHTIAASDFHP